MSPPALGLLSSRAVLPLPCGSPVSAAFPLAPLRASALPSSSPSAALTLSARELVEQPQPRGEALPSASRRAQALWWRGSFPGARTEGVQTQGTEAWSQVYVSSREDRERGSEGLATVRAGGRETELQAVGVTGRALIGLCGCRFPSCW